MPDGANPDRAIALSQPPSDEVKTTTCYMCACRCGIRVHLKEGQLRYIEGNPDHPVNKGVLCAKGSAGIMNQLSPAKLRKPLKRVGERGSGDYVEIEWDEAMTIATERLAKIRAEDPRKLAFFTGRDQSQGLTGWWASQFGTPNHAAHGGFCSVNMAAAGLYTLGGAFWEFGEPDWEETKLFLLFGVAEDHDSNPIKMGLARLKERGAKIVSINPVRGGYSAIADEWISITPGSDGLFILSLCRELLRAGKIDIEFLAQFSNAAHLVVDAPGTAEHGLIARDAEDRALVWDRKADAARPFPLADGSAAMKGRFTLSDGRHVIPAFELVARRLDEAAYAPDAVSERTGVPAATIRRLAAEIAEAAFDNPPVVEEAWEDAWGRRHDRVVGRPVSAHAMRGISAHSNGFHTCRSIHILQLLLGAVDRPGSWRYKPPFPRPTPPGQKPAGKPHQVVAGQPLPGPPLGFVTGPEDLLLDDSGQPQRIDKAYSWEAPVAAHGLMHMVITNAWKGDPYPIDTLFMYMANMAWNSAMNTGETIKMLTDKDPVSGEYKIPFIIYADAFASETVYYADLVLPDTTYLERWDCISLLDRPICDAESAADAIRQPILTPDRDVRPFQSVLIDLGARLGLPGLVTETGEPRYPGGYADYIVNHERKPGVGPLAGFRGEDGKGRGRGAVNPKQLEAYIANGCFWREEIPEDARHHRFANQAYLDWSSEMGFIERPTPILLQLYGEVLQRFRLAAEGHGPVQPPDRLRARVEAAFDPLPLWFAPFEDEGNDEADYPLHGVTQRPMAMYHSWHGQNAWLRQIHSTNRLYVPRALAEAEKLVDDDWVWAESRHGKIKAQVRVMQALNAKTVWTWNAIGKRSGSWNLDPAATEATRGFLLNHLIDELLPEQGGYRYANSDPVTGQAAWYDLRLRVRKMSAEEAAVAAKPVEGTLPKLPGLGDPPDRLLYRGGKRESGA
ncbi:MAG: molybdopterin oxidoreductase family protein [Rhodospirillales bacterium]